MWPSVPSDVWLNGVIGLGVTRDPSHQRWQPPVLAEHHRRQLEQGLLTARAMEGPMR